MAMGLQGYLSQLTPDRIYSITDKVCTIYCDLLYELCTLQNNHELTTIGLILGLAAEKWVVSLFNNKRISYSATHNKADTPLY